MTILVLCGALSLAAAEPPDSQAVRDQLAAGGHAIDHRAFKIAIESYEKADKLAGGKSAPALVGLAVAENGVGRWDRAIASVRRALALEPQEVEVRTAAYDQLGLGLSGKAGRQDRSGLGEAAKAFSKVLEIDPAETTSARFNLGVVLLRLGRDEEGKAALAEYVSRRPDGPAVLEAKALLADPRRAREDFVPEFQLTTLKGETITPATLQGKVVLLDFWATWCGPCVAALPEVKALVKRMAGEPFVVIGLSADRDGAKLRQFIADKGIDWPQVWDETGNVIGRTFNVHAFPTYMVLDIDGRIVAQHSGWSSRGDSQLQREIHQALTAAKKAQPKEKAVAK